MYKPVQMIQFHNGETQKTYLEFKVAKHLRRHICCYWASPLGVVGSYVERLVPDGCMELLFGMDKEGNSCRNIIVGTMSEGTTVNMENGNIQTFGVRFYPGGLQAFIGEGADKFTNRMEFSDMLGNGSFKELQDCLSKLGHISDKIELANQYFTSKLKTNIQWEDSFQNIAYNIYKARGNIKLNELASREVISEKQITRIVNNRAGVSTKELVNIIRVQYALKLINSSGKRRIADIAVDAGYYDQSHFTKEFSKFCGINPSEYLKRVMLLNQG